ncbi:hypothetical protein H4Q26_010017 [Puccinia striiformis f. sp. tritici PST-130]|nr:hypothetical protein H4Q26_010017 [Puccinia striiformis f. sp. tritici PST-130]
MNTRTGNQKIQQLPNSLGVLLKLNLSFNQLPTTGSLPAQTQLTTTLKRNNIDTSSQPLTLEIKEEIKELLRNGMKPKKIGEELQPEYPNHQITAAQIYELGKQIKNQKTPENSLVQQLRESLAESSFFNETKYNKDGDINIMLQSLSDSLKVKAQAILDNFDPEKLTKINSFFNNCLGKISNLLSRRLNTTLLKLVNLHPPHLHQFSHNKDRHTLQTSDFGTSGTWLAGSARAF